MRTCGSFLASRSKKDDAWHVTAWAASASTLAKVAAQPSSVQENSPRRSAAAGTGDERPGSDKAAVRAIIASYELELASASLASALFCTSGGTHRPRSSFIQVSVRAMTKNRLTDRLTPRRRKMPSTRCLLRSFWSWLRFAAAATAASSLKGRLRLSIATGTVVLQAAVATRS